MGRRLDNTVAIITGEGAAAAAVFRDVANTEHGRIGLLHGNTGDATMAGATGRDQAACTAGVSLPVGGGLSCQAA